MCLGKLMINMTNVKYKTGERLKIVYCAVSFFTDN